MEFVAGMGHVIPTPNIGCPYVFARCLIHTNQFVLTRIRRVYCHIDSLVVTHAADTFNTAHSIVFHKACRNVARTVADGYLVAIALLLQRRVLWSPKVGICLVIRPNPSFRRPIWQVRTTPKEHVRSSMCLRVEHCFFPPLRHARANASFQKTDKPLQSA